MIFTEARVFRGSVKLKTGIGGGGVKGGGRLDYSACHVSSRLVLRKYLKL